ncbi:hypothetical protein [Desulfovibrio litoralis]|uniref:Trehalose synthase n=1 Tax=Desulfovibrio litoralis DSM 11393 TaxID=1121455 RepID=A0A1M7S801_9BACT|nr:hypothetical protein [Desulfovibrio litoralis]SHN54789.1 trehalose synthase [Desulfovibrio litoralis DSM 11393]
MPANSQYIKNSILLLLILLITLISVSCSSKKKNKEQDGANYSASFNPLSRADPGYVQYLEKLSMLGQSVEMARIVSGSNLSWRTPASPPDPDGLLKIADNWINIHPYSLLSDGGKGTFSELSSPQLWSAMHSAGFRGLFIAPTSTAGSVWAYDQKKSPTGDDVIQYTFSDVVGKEESYRRMLAQANKNQALLGLDMIPAATGLGPDFFLAARWHKDYAGVYSMVEVDKAYWDLLPTVESQWKGKALDSTQIQKLSEKGVIPFALEQDGEITGADRGWAATGLINGIDGANRRWLYRYYYSPEHVVINWEDPSATAKRILSGSAVREVGMLGAALLGLNLEPLQGLEPEASTAYSGEPALSAATSIGREVRRYGGWTFLRDELPLSHIASFTADGPDFIYNSVLSPATEHALLSGDATLLRFMIDEALRLNINFKHLVNTTPNNNGISYSMPHLLDLANHNAQSGNEQSSKAESLRAEVISQMKEKAGDGQDRVPFKNERLLTTSAGLALLALDIRNPEELKPEIKKEAEKGLFLMNFFKAMQPGIFMVSGQDLVGALPLHWQAMVDHVEEWDEGYATRGAYGLLRTSGSLFVTKNGIARTKTLFSSIDEQVYTQGSMVNRLGGFLKVRSNLGLARAETLGRIETKGEGSVAVLHKLPDNGGYFITIANFSRTGTNETLNLSPFKEQIGSIIKAENIEDNTKNPSVNGSQLNVSLGAWQGMAILLKTK